MKSVPNPISRANVIGLLAATLLVGPVSAEDLAQDAVELTKEVAKEKVAKADKEADEKPDQKDPQPKARLFLTNGDKLTGLPESIDDEMHLLFESESLRQTAGFPIDNVLAIDFNSWKQQPNPQTIARVQLHPRFRETNGDTILGGLQELTPDSIKLETWYGGILTLKRSMVQSLKIINNTPGNYFGPNNIKEWELTGDKSSWTFQNGKLSSHLTGGIGRDMGLREKSHISFDAHWASTMRFKIRLYSSDITKTSPEAYYEVNLNRSYAYMQTRGKTNKGGGRLLGGGRWKQISIKPENNYAHFDFYINRKTGTISIYMDGVNACTLQSQSPDPENLGTGLSFLAEERYPVEFSGITVSPWNGTSLPKTVRKLAPAKDGEPKAEEEPKEDKPPHRIILNNGDEVPGTVGKVMDGKMLIETEFTPIRIPINRIKSLSLGDKGEQPVKKQGDVRAWFHNGGHVTIMLKSFKDGKITGYSQALGDVTFDLAAFSQIDFHIYDNKANELRKNIR